MRTMLTVVVAAGLLGVGAPAAAQAQAPEEAEAGQLRGWVSGLFGASAQSRYFAGEVSFPNGSTDSLSIEPEASVVGGLWGGLYLTEIFSTYLGLSYSAPTASYVEGDDARPDVRVGTTKIDLGAALDVATLRPRGLASPISVGGGISMAYQSIDELVWNEMPMSVSSFSIGVHLLSALDVALTETWALRAQLKLAAIPLNLGDLEDSIAEIEGQRRATVESGTMAYGELALGATYRF